MRTMDLSQPTISQRRVVLVLVAGQILGGLGTGATLSLGALLIGEISGTPAWSGLASTMSAVGAALLALPLASLAQARGRRRSLSTGALTAAVGAAVTVTAAALGSLALLLLGIVLLGAAQAVNLQSRFAATDLAPAESRGRDLSLVVWSTTLGAVAGPLLLGPGELLGRTLGMPPLTGAFAISATAQLTAAVVYLTGLRPDPLLTARARGVEASRPEGSSTTSDLAPESPWRAILTVALSHAVMVALMSMTPVHLQGQGASLSIIGVTISLHIAGMYGLSPIFGILTDRAGARSIVLLGQAMLAAALVLSLLGAGTSGTVTAGLILLGLGWSASTVAGSVLVSRAGVPAQRPRIQGLSDMLMNIAGAVGGASAGVVLTAIGFNGLAGVLLIPVLVVVILQLRSRRR